MCAVSVKTVAFARKVCYDVSKKELPAASGRGGHGEERAMSPFLLLAALLPAIILMNRVYKLDKIEKEPPRVLWALIGCGALSAGAAYILEVVLTAVLDDFLPEGSMAYLAIENFVIVAFSEELCKRFPVRTLFWKNRAFDYRFDAVVYCVFSALGFAALENVLYVAESGLQTAIMRALLSVPGHFFFAVYMGVYLGEAKVCEAQGKPRARRYYLWGSLIVPTLLHGFWDFDLSLDAPWATVAFYVFVLVFFLRANRLLHRASENDVCVG